MRFIGEMLEIVLGAGFIVMITIFFFSPFFKGRR